MLLVSAADFDRVTLRTVSGSFAKTDLSFIPALFTSIKAAKLLNCDRIAFWQFAEDDRSR